MEQCDDVVKSLGSQYDQGASQHGVTLLEDRQRLRIGLQDDRVHLNMKDKDLD